MFVCLFVFSCMHAFGRSVRKNGRYYNLVIKVWDSRSVDLRFNITGWLQLILNLSSIQDLLNEYQDVQGLCGKKKNVFSQ